MFVLLFVVCCAGSGLCNELITHSEESHRVLCVQTVCDLETATMRQRLPKLRISACCSIVVFECLNINEGMDVRFVVRCVV